jgi:hypothetical protein
MNWFFVIVTYIFLGTDQWSYGIVPSPGYRDHVECEAHRQEVNIGPAPNSVITVYPCTDVTQGQHTPPNLEVHR